MMSSEGLPRHLYRRGNKLWCNVKDERGKWVSKSTGYSIDEVDKAVRYVKAAQKQLDAKRDAGIAAERSDPVVRWELEAERCRAELNRERALWPRLDGAYVYFLQAADRIKIGRSRDLADAGRVADLQTGNHIPLRAVLLVPGGAKLERRLQSEMASFCCGGEWFVARAVLEKMAEDHPHEYATGIALACGVVPPDGASERRLAIYAICRDMVRRDRFDKREDRDLARKFLACCEEDWGLPPSTPPVPREEDLMRERIRASANQRRRVRACE